MISGRGFSDLCSWNYEPRYPKRSFSQLGSRTGDWVFVSGYHLDSFLAIRLLTPKRFVIVVHNSDVPFDSDRLTRTLPCALHIYAVNTTVTHPQLTTIPLGFPDSGLQHLRSVPSQPKTIEIYANFSMTNYGKRKECLDAFEGDSRVVRKDPHGRTQIEYYTDLRRSKFALCPEGVGVDTHRIYEALYFGAVPIVLRNSLSSFYEKLPICIVDKWTDPFYVPTGTVSFDPKHYLTAFQP